MDFSEEKQRSFKSSHVLAYVDAISEGFWCVLASLSFPFVIGKGVFVINTRSVDLFLYINKLTAKRLASAMDMQYSLFLSNATSYFSNILEVPVPVLNMNIRWEKSNWGLLVLNNLWCPCAWLLKECYERIFLTLKMLINIFSVQVLWFTSRLTKQSPYVNSPGHTKFYLQRNVGLGFFFSYFSCTIILSKILW